MITSILNGSINNSQFEKEDYFGLLIPKSVENVDNDILKHICTFIKKKQEKTII